jgi:hypothetical protein
MDLTHWIRSRAATGQPLNTHAVARERPDLLDLAFAGPAPRGWRRSLIDAGVDPYTIVLQYEDTVECAVCGLSFVVLGEHIKHSHAMTSEEYFLEFGDDHENTSETYRARLTGLRPIAGVAHWEHLWSRHYVVDWLLLLHDRGDELNFFHLADVGLALTKQAVKRFGSWDGALRAAGLDPAVLRAKPPGRQWTRTMVIEGLRNFAKLRQDNPRRKMIRPLRAAASRVFPSLEAACQAAGLAYVEINPWPSFTDKAVAAVVAAIRTMEPLKGRERLDRLDAIYHHKDNQRIVMRHYGSLQVLAAKEGIAARVVSRTTYRDEADVQHDLDLLEREGKPLTVDTLISLKNGLYGLYLVMTETGWGRERLTRKVVPPSAFPPCDPRSKLLRDRMISLRRRLRISIAAAAVKAGVSAKAWGRNEKRGTPAAATAEKIEWLLAEHHIPGSTEPRPPRGDSVLREDQA